MTEKKPSHTYRLQTMSVPELAEGMVKARMRLNRQGLLHRGRKLKDGPLLNAIVAWYLGRPDADQDAIAREGLREFEAILMGEESGSSPTTDGHGTASPRGRPMAQIDPDALARADEARPARKPKRA